MQSSSSADSVSSSAINPLEQLSPSYLYQICLDALQHLYRQKEGEESHQSDSLVLRDDLQRLYLWGEAFEHGALDQASSRCNDLKAALLELLGDIGRLILQSIFVWQT